MNKLHFNTLVYVECQECETREEGDSEKWVRKILKKDGWLTRRWTPPGYDVDFDLLCPDCVEAYKDEGNEE